MYGRRQSHRSKEDSDESDLDEDATSSPVDGAALRQPERRTRHSAKGAGEQHGACAPREVADKNGGRKSQRPLVAAHPSAMQAIGSLQVGDIVKAEFIAGVRKLNKLLPPGEQLSDRDADAIMSALDLQKNDKIDINEFLEGFRLAGVVSPSSVHAQRGSWYG